MRILLLAHPGGAIDRLNTVINREEGQNDLVLIVGPFGDDTTAALQALEQDSALVKAVPAPTDDQETMKQLSQERMLLHTQTISMAGTDIIGLGSIDGPQMDVEAETTDAEDEALERISTALLDRTDADQVIMLTYRNPREFGTDTSRTVTRLRGVTGIEAIISGQAGRQDSAELDGCQVINPGDLREGEYAVLATDTMETELCSL